MVGLHKALLWSRYNEIDDHRCAARKASRGTRLEIFARDSSHKRQLHMRMWVDSARHDVLTARVNDRRSTRSIEIGPYCDDLPIVAKHIGSNRLFRVYYCTALDENAHALLPISPRAAR